ncbi:MAG: DUF4405 domain-containing protein [Kovacikia sp.]
MKPTHSFNPKAYIRAVVAIALLVSWGLTACTGFLLWLAPTGKGVGRLPLFLGLTRHEWGEVHFVLSVIALGITIIHIVVDWRALRGVLRYLVNFNRPPNLLE